MHVKPVYCAGTTPALKYARDFLSLKNIPVADSPGWNIGHLLLDIPSFRPGSPLYDAKNLDTLLSSLPRDVTVWGGNLENDALDHFRTIDLLKDETYLSENAAITAQCTLNVISPLLKTTWPHTSTLIIGWGRIGKCLSRLMDSLGCPLTIAARSEKDRTALDSQGFQSVNTKDISPLLSSCRLVINTVPAPILTIEDFEGHDNCIKIDLASTKGIAGEDVIWARGLPGIYAPECSGRLIAETFLRLIKEDEK